MQSIIDLAGAVVATLWTTLLNVLSYPVTPSERLYWLYILTSLSFALGAYLVFSARGTHTESSALSFLLPSDILKHPSTWVDIRYFLPHQMVRFWIYGPFVLSVFGAVSVLTVSCLETVFEPQLSPLFTFNVYWMVGFTVLTSVLTDFGVFVVHTLQHRLPVLWAFHKVHHSATRLNPLSNYREHPVDNLLYALTHGMLLGCCTGVAVFLFKLTPTSWALWGVAVPMVAFNLLGYHLRHSHIWVRWPGRLGMLFGCPAHHQIHHSFAPEHIHKNMAFMFPIWDVLFGSFCLPDTKPAMTFGVGDGTESSYDGFLSIYVRPFKDLLVSSGREVP
jgi:sterol desaturase/sphingolipid hydroxylase (fatty acid hydroxylase superfamily)